jgi:GNAT superfamily N-acetyltransferase
MRGSGLGRRLMDAALTYGAERGFSRIFLWTFADLAGARRLYERAGFKTIEAKTGLIWGAERTELRMEMELGPPEVA